MEIALDTAMPTYAGGLGILAGDTIRSAADLKIPIVAVTLLHRKGYLRQRLDASGWQCEEPADWKVESFARELPQRAQVMVQGRPVHIRAWQHDVQGATGFTAPVFLLDTDLPENSPWARTLTHFLYGGDPLYRFCQEAILGIGGVRMLRALGFRNLRRFHMNEGHASLLTFELLRERAAAAGKECVCDDDLDAVRSMCIFTTHTPVPAGHDQFPMDLVMSVLGAAEGPAGVKELFCVNLTNNGFGTRRELSEFKSVMQAGNTLNMTYVALNLSHYINGVAKKHGEVSRLMFAGYEIDAITNGVHAATWTSPPFQELFDQRIPGWRQDNFSLRFAHSIPRPEILAAHRAAKKNLIDFVRGRSNVTFDPNIFTLGFARRATKYKRADLLLRDIERLRGISQRAGKFQVVYGGKAHPNDREGKEVIRRILQVKESLMPDVEVVYLENYDMETAKVVTAGVDLWLNTPQPPLEASGTSGMKAALNGVPSLSVLDGWWIEGCIEGETGWAIGAPSNPGDTTARDSADAESLYGKLERIILPLYYQNCDGYVDMMRHAISLNGSFFNTQRMIQQYVLKAYLI